MKEADEHVVDYSILVTGNELLTGVYPDGHTHFLTRTLRPLGLRCVGSMSVDDQAADIQQALQFACSHSRLVIVTGGLGPTDSDITREVLSEFTGIALAEHPDVLQSMEQRLNTPRDKLRANLRRQTRVPTRGTYLTNAAGSAVGLVFEAEKAIIVALPGPPRELQPMVRDALVPYLARRFGTRTNWLFGDHSLHRHRPVADRPDDERPHALADRRVGDFPVRGRTRRFHVRSAERSTRGSSATRATAAGIPPAPGRVHLRGRRDDHLGGLRFGKTAGRRSHDRRGGSRQRWQPGRCALPHADGGAGCGWSFCGSHRGAVAERCWESPTRRGMVRRNRTDWNCWRRPPRSARTASGPS